LAPEAIARRNAAAIEPDRIHTSAAKGDGGQHNWFTSTWQKRHCDILPAVRGGDPRVRGRIEWWCWWSVTAALGAGLPSEPFNAVTLFGGPIPYINAMDTLGQETAKLY